MMMLLEAGELEKLKFLCNIQISLSNLSYPVDFQSF